MSNVMQRTFIAYVEDRPGVLNRVTSLFRRRGYNIHSLTVGNTEREGISRMTIVMDADDDSARRIEANILKLVDVLSVKDATRAATVVRELALVKVRANASNRTHVMQVCDVFRARVVDVGPDALVAEITGSIDKIEGLVEVLRPFGILEMARTGAAAMLRSAETSRVDDNEGSGTSAEKPAAPSDAELAA
jgi:acetolactate synthase-1/3 small subunit